MFQPVRGTHDFYGEECQKYLHILDIFRTTAKLYHYDDIITPIFEFSEVFQRLGDTSDVIPKETYTFQDRGGDTLTLRPEGTASVVRAALSNGLIHNLPLKFFYAGPMFRYERPQKGRFRQFDQAGIELCGVPYPQADCEVIAMGAHVLDRLKLQGNITLEINTLGDQASRLSYRSALVAYCERYQSSLSQDSQDRLLKNPLRILDSKDPRDQDILKDAPTLEPFLSPESHRHFESVLKGLELLKIPYHLNPKLVRGLDYYCHTTFEFVSSALGAQSTVLAGGRYDGLFKMMEGPDLAGIGWAAGLQRLMLLSDVVAVRDPLLCLIPLGEQAETYALTLSRDLRKSGISVDVCFSGTLSKKMKHADKIKAVWAVIVGETELTTQSVIVRDLRSGAQQSVLASDLISYLSSEQERFLCKAPTSL